MSTKTMTTEEMIKAIFSQVMNKEPSAESNKSDAKKDKTPAAAANVPDLLKGMTEEQIRAEAKLYDPKSVNIAGLSHIDFLRGDMNGTTTKRRKAAYEWVKANNTPAPTQPIEVASKQNNSAKQQTTNSTPAPTQPVAAASKPNNSAQQQPINNVPASTQPVAAASTPSNPVQQQTINNAPVLANQPAAAASILNNAFNISNFIKQTPAPANPANATHHHKSVFPHEICGLTNEQIVNEVTKHFKINEELPAYSLYDLLKNKHLSEKMKEYGSKQRPNNPFLIQVDINRYVDDPEILKTYNTCFITPCKDKQDTIVVLFNTTPVMDACGCSNYPLNIFKTKYKKVAK